MTSVSGSGERILSILDLFSEARPEWRPEEMMETLGYSRPTLYRYLKTLKDAGYLVSNAQAAYTLGPKVTELDFLMRRADPLIAASADCLPRLADLSRGSAFVLRWYGRRLLCIASTTRAAVPRSSYPRGRPMPLGRGAGSRAIVAFLPKDRRLALIGDHFAEFAPEDADTTREAIDREMAQVRRAGVAVAHGEVTPGLVGIAAPILTGDGMPVGALCLSTEQEGLAPRDKERLCREIRRMAEEVSCRLDPVRTRRTA